MSLLPFFLDLERVVPALRHVREEHVADNDELLSHLLMADIRRWLAKHVFSDPASVLAVLNHLEVAVDADEGVDEIVCVSLLEGLGQPPAVDGEDALRLYLGPVLSARLKEIESLGE